MSYVYPLTQFEVRFTHILNFNQVVREVLSPYLRIASSFNFANQGRFEESIRLDFEEDLFAIDCRWDRLVFLCEDDPMKFTKPNSMLKIFWEILEKLIQVPTFGALQYCLFVEYEINLIDNTAEEILIKFKEKYFTKSIDRMMSDPSDVGVTLEKTNSKKQTTLAFGLYSNNDNKKYGLFPFNSSSAKEIEKKFGTLLKFQIFDEYKKIDTNSFKRFVDEQKNHSSHYIL